LLKHRVPGTVNLFKGAPWVGRPAIELWVAIMMVEESKDVCHQGSDTAKAPATNHLSGDFSEEAFDEIKPGRGSWGEMQMKPRMTFEPSEHFGVFVSGGVVADQVHVKLGGHLALYLAQEGEPFLMAMTPGGVREQLRGDVATDFRIRASCKVLVRLWKRFSNRRISACFVATMTFPHTS
jgi:hypothetical protein